MHTLIISVPSVNCVYTNINSHKYPQKIYKYYKNRQPTTCPFTNELLMPL